MFAAKSSSSVLCFWGIVIIVIFQDGGCIVGPVSKDSGAMTGPNIAYIYPDGKTAIIGRFLDGQLVKGQYGEVINIKKRVPCFRKYGKTLLRGIFVM